MPLNKKCAECMPLLCCVDIDVFVGEKECVFLCPLWCMSMQHAAMKREYFHAPEYVHVVPRVIAPIFYIIRAVQKSAMRQYRGLAALNFVHPAQNIRCFWKEKTDVVIQCV